VFLLVLIQVYELGVSLRCLYLASRPRSVAARHRPIRRPPSLANTVLTADGRMTRASVVPSLTTAVTLDVGRALGIAKDAVTNVQSTAT